MFGVVSEEEANKSISNISSSFTIFLIVIIIVLIGLLAVFAASASFYSELRKKGCGSSITSGEADVMYWLNFIAALLCGVLVIVGIFYMLIIRIKPQWGVKYYTTTFPNECIGTSP